MEIATIEDYEAIIKDLKQKIERLSLVIHNQWQPIETPPPKGILFEFYEPGRLGLGLIYRQGMAKLGT